MNRESIRNLPGAEFVLPGLDDLLSGRLTEAALLVASGASRLRELGIEVPSAAPKSPEHKLYELLLTTHGDGAYSRYNSLIRRLVSFNRALERQVRASGGTGAPARVS